MVCKKCGAETLADGAVYCAACGNRLDGKIQCENCNQFNDGGNVFCVYCGTRIDGKTVCKHCGELMEGAFCAKCGGAAEKPVKKSEKSATSNKQKLWDKVFDLSSGGVVLLGAVFALIFVFLIGFVGVTTEMTATKTTAAKESINIYYFFGNAYKDLADTKTQFADMQCEQLLIGDAYLYAIICTILAAATIACVVGFVIPAIVSYVKYATGKTEKMDSKWALLTIFSFLGGVAALFAQNYMNTKTANSGTTQTIVTKASGATIAGVVLCIVFAGLWFAAKMVSYGKQWKEKAFIKKAVCVTLSVCLLSAFFGVLPHLAQSMEIITATNSGSITSSLVTTENFVITKCSPCYYNEYFLALAETMLGNGALVKLEPNLMAFYVSNILMVFVSVAGVVCVAGNLYSRCLAADGKKYAGLIFSIVLFALTVVALVLFIVMNANANVIFERTLLDKSSSMEVNYGYGACIAVMILAGLNLASSITQTVIVKEKTE